MPVGNQMTAVKVHPDAQTLALFTHANATPLCPVEGPQASLPGPAGGGTEIMKDSLHPGS
eukprot:CAMPEP_0174310160 /NCGR_PEP_ID=MMETSP0810-20121108/2871_1 /TAXON_ID=73025 ORGANISM="Eutreptiella gymnastica-like, Strain CCMP1594" /NCGR_SAMPLE_ID=MMETSP0810 /ASSEMBLY_ACC=CAM_ASM_000659 /LENGTH=59 /DNA_ID=CAMNT_0015417993 /DNA_START=759 /DNA_END=938 /DNA_ORIENTATION=-